MSVEKRREVFADLLISGALRLPNGMASRVGREMVAAATKCQNVTAQIAQLREALNQAEALLSREQARAVLFMDLIYEEHHDAYSRDIDRQLQTVDESTQPPIVEETPVAPAEPVSCAVDDAEQHG